MSNVHYLPTANRAGHEQRITSGSHRDGLARAVSLSALPSWVIADHDLNRASHILMQSGWRFEIAFEHVRQVYFSNARVKTIPARLIDIVEALQLQGILGVVKS